MALRMPTMATTIISSIRVKPPCRRRLEGEWDWVWGICTGKPFQTSQFARATAGAGAEPPAPAPAPGLLHLAPAGARGGFGHAVECFRFTSGIDVLVLVFGGDHGMGTLVYLAAHHDIGGV